jgi:hypothetical protein
MRSKEHLIQAAYFNWVRLKEQSDLRYAAIFAIPNGGHRHISVARKLKLEGVKAGVWDVLCAVPNGAHIGLWLEFKIKPNKPTDSQIEFGEIMRRNGFQCVVAYSTEEAIHATDIYFRKPLQRTA